MASSSHLRIGQGTIRRIVLELINKKYVREVCESKEGRSGLAINSAELAVDG